MVSSLQASYLSQEERKQGSNTQTLSTKKRKWQEEGEEKSKPRSEEYYFTREPKLWKKDKKSNDIELHLDAPLPLEWQRCLDIKSGQIHFYNSRTQKRTSKDPRCRPETQSSGLDLELNLNLNLMSSNCEKSTKHVGDHKMKSNDCLSTSSSSSSSASTLSWISVDIDRQEMVAAVCMRCHMLVMMCKESPSCPNCKFVHPQGHTSASNLLVKPRCGLLC